MKFHIQSDFDFDGLRLQLKFSLPTNSHKNYPLRKYFLVMIAKLKKLRNVLQ